MATSKAAGSSPHTRGAPVRAPSIGLLRRIIPAYAGSTRRVAWAGLTAADHPRIRGEHIQKQSADSTGKGSSPHTRGAPSSLSSSFWVSVDHPRIRGEHGRDIVHVGPPAGSSPHTRGAPGEDCLGHLMCRIIPAYAGSTGSIRWLLLRCWDHPRIRGEHETDTLAHKQQVWIIPAYAGSTSKSV